MDKGRRRKHKAADSTWDLGGTNKEGFSRETTQLIVLLDLRAVLHDLLDEQRETNRIIRLALGADPKKDE